MKEISRRSFVFASGAGILGTAAWGSSLWASSKPPYIPQAPPPVGGPTTAKEKLPPLAEPSEVQSERLTGLPPEERIGFAIVGLGHLSLDEILPAFGASRLCKPVALVSGDPSKAERIGKQYGIGKNGLYDYKNFDRIANNKDVKVVYIVLPNSMHKEFVIRSAAAGKDVLCEKPMASTLPDAEAMVEAMKKSGRKFMVAYRQQYEPWNRMLREMIAKESFGKLKIAEAANLQNQNAGAGVNQWRHKKALAGGGALPDIGLYCLNGIRYLTGEEPIEVSAQSYSTPHDPRFKEVEEAMIWQMRFPSGLLANCATSYGAHNNKRLRITSEHGYVGLDPAFSYRGMQGEISSPDGDFELRSLPKITEVNQFASEMDHMADCVRNGKKPMSGGEEALQDHVIMDAIYQSAAKRQPVMLKRYDKRDMFRNPASLV